MATTPAAGGGPLAAPATDASAIRMSGVLMLCAGAAILMAIITAEALFPASYNTSHNEISDLGSTWNPGGIVREPSAAIFNIAMIVTGALIVVAAVLLSARVARGPFRFVAAALGLLALVSLLLSGTLGDTRLGTGGAERWIAYPTVLWLVAFGGYLLAARPEELVRAPAPAVGRR